MSLAPIHAPHIFTSTMTDHEGNPSQHGGPGVNIYIIILTAILFFAVLGWFNFALAFYGTMTTTDPDHHDETLSTFGFAVLWSLITVAIYYAMLYYGVLGGSDSSEKSDHPLLRGEGSDVISDTGYVGQIDIAGI
jgi:heme/copper-type cytochrome/quinol oxidase subunit 2